MGKVCKSRIKISDDSLFSDIDLLCNNNDILRNNYIANVSDGQYLENDFLTWYKDTKGKDLDVKKVSKLEFAKSVIDYYYHVKPSVTHSASNIVDNDNVTTFGYENTEAREQAKLHIGTFMLKAFMDDQIKHREITGNVIKHYTDKASAKWNNHIFEEAALRGELSIDEIKAGYKNAQDKCGYLEGVLGNKDMSSRARALFAVWKELHSNPKTVSNFINETLSDQKFQEVLMEGKDDMDTLESAIHADANYELNGGPDANGQAIVDYNPDDMIGNANNHIGAYSNFMKHISARVRNYFNTLDRLISTEKSDGEYIKDINNRYGIAECMDANACCTLLYAHPEMFASTDAMINGIRKLANLPGYEAFAKFADDLEQDQDFATEVRTVFEKEIMSKFQIRVSNGTASVIDSNQRSDAFKSLLFGLANDIRATAIDTEVNSLMSLELEKLNDERKTIKDDIDSLYDENTTQKDKDETEAHLPKELNKIIAHIVKLFKIYYPSIQPSSITAYIDLNNDANGADVIRLENIDKLITALKDTHAASEETIKAWYSRQDLLNRINIYNKQIQQEIRKGHWHYSSDYIDVNVVLDKDFIPKKQNSAYRSLANMLLPYTIPQLQLNSPNVHGNNSSDVINSSYLTNLTKILKDTVVINGQRRNQKLEEWGKRKLRSKQYKYSTILVEQYDENGQPLNDAIFRYDANGDLCLTENAESLLSIALFDGSSDMDNGTNMTYPEMTQGDFLPTAFLNYFKCPQSEDHDTPLGNYFLRTPSDAPKTFCLTAPKYDVSDLETVENQQGLNDTVDQMIADIPYMSKEYFDENYATPRSLENITDDRFVQYILGTGTFYVPDMEAVKELEDGTVLVNCVRVVNQNGVPTLTNRFTFKGTLEDRGRGKQLTNYRLVGARSGTEQLLPESIESALRNVFRAKLINRDVTFNGKTYEGFKTVINRNHKVFKLLKNQFKQEMLNAAIALDTYFDLDSDGWIKHQTDEESDTKVIKTKRDNTKGYAFYHLGKNGRVLEKKNGHYYLGGKVFHSNKFTLTIKDDNGNDVTVNYLDDVISMEPTPVELNEETGVYEATNDGKIHILYGGADTNSYLHVKRDENNKVVDVDLSYQDELINQKLEEFLRDYLAQAYDTVSNYESFIKGIGVNNENIRDFAVNHLVTFMAYDDLFEGESKFYKDSQTVLKRAKEYQGSGIPYGIVDYSDIDSDIDPYHIPLASNSYLNEGTYEMPTIKEAVRNGKKVKVSTTKTVNVQDMFKGTILEGLKQRTRFTGVTIKNTKMTNTETLDELVDHLTSQLVAGGMNAEKARNHAKDILYGPEVYNKETEEWERRGGFTETKVNDAQSYITFEEWVRRVAAKGQLKKYMPLIQRIINERYIDKNDPNNIIDKNRYDHLTPEQKANYIIEPLDASDIKEFIQVQKNFYYDMQYDKEYGIYVPRQIKNAEFVLVPRLIKGTQLEKVYKLMKEAQIDQLNTVETSKASNEELLTLWDNDGNLTGADTFVYNVKQKKALQVYDYKHLYTQQETPQHIAAENKAGIQIMKKIIDNIPSDHPLAHKKDEFLKLYIENIKDSFTSLMDELNIEVDDDGNIVFKDGHIKSKAGDNFDTQVFYDKLRDEMLRLGLDNNMLDYVTLDEYGRPKMPAFMANVLDKFESIVQSMFNSNITRQKLPGFHAAQVTNIGWESLGESLTGRKYNEKLDYHPMTYIDSEGNVISKRKYNSLSTEERKNYKKHKPASYIEVMLPASNFGIDRNSSHYKNMTDEEIIKELEDKGLDIVMGYRMPTEGKQSVCNMKIVGFTDDSYGSTIIVPNDWVSQTGSDFDIDTVYGIHFETYTTHDGELHKIDYVKDDDKDKGHRKPDKYDWVSYVKRLADNSDVNTAIKEVFDKRYKELQSKEEAAYDELPEYLQEKIKKVDKRINKTLEGLDKRNKYIKRLEERIYSLNKVLANRNDKNKVDADQLEQYVELSVQLLKFLNGQADTFRKQKKDALGSVDDNLIEELNKVAESSGIHTLESFMTEAKEHPERLNTRRARNNQILQSMLDILGDDSSLEENLSRSNFDDIIYWRDQVMNDNDKVERSGRSTYNIFDQIKYQEDAMSGAMLKGMSVALDTWCSICNAVRPTLTRPVYIVYDKNDFDNPQDVADRFNSKEKITKKSKTFAIRHTSYGWSNDNRNVSGKILTAYSSQTTAHILDAIKEGAIPGVNSYTFSVYKTLVNIGSDYKTAISFIMQPGVKRIVDNYNANNSVFSRTYDNPVHQAIKDIAIELGVVAKDDIKTPVVAILNMINTKEEYRKIFNELFKQPGVKELSISLSDEDLQDLPIVVPALCDRIKNKGVFKEGIDDTKTPVKKLIFDLGVILSFNQLNRTANEVGNIARCCNPDKFGAKQTVFATNKVFEDIHYALYDYDSEQKQKSREAILTVDNNHILEAIYPGISDGTKDDPISGIRQVNRISESKYPTMYAFLKYASTTSTIIAKELFDTQHPTFVAAVKGFTKVLSGINPQLDEQTYNDLQKYILSHFYNNVPSIAHPIVYKKGRTKEDRVIINTEGSVLEERSRIFGFGHSSAIEIADYVPVVDENGKETGGLVVRTESVEVEDVNNPKPKEIEKFSKLSPAQKVKWIQRNFDETGIFGMLDASLYNDARRGWRCGMQTIEFTEQVANSNVVYRAFYDAFFTDNPLIYLAAFDLVKYAVVVEGLRMTNRGITKIIDNDAFINDFGRQGTGFVKMVDDQISTLGTKNNDLSDDNVLEEIYENYLRGHKDVKGIRKIFLSNTNKSKYGIDVGNYGIVHLPVTSLNENTKPEDIRKEWQERLKKAGVLTYYPVQDVYVENEYIRLNTRKTSTLYKICPIKDKFGITQEIILYPFNSLEQHESSDLSAKQSNNGKYALKQVYKYIVDEYQKEFLENDEQQHFDSVYISGKVEEFREQGNEIYKNVKEELNISANTRDFNIEDLASEDVQGMLLVKEKIVNHFNGLTTSKLYINSKALSEYIFSSGPQYSSTQKIKMPNGEYREFVVSKLNTSSYERKYLRKLKDGTYKFTDEEVARKLQREKDPQIREAIINARQAKLEKLDTLFVVTPKIEDTVKVDRPALAATQEELEVGAYDFMKVDKQHGNELAISGCGKMSAYGIDSTEESIKAHAVDAAREIAKFANKRVVEIKHSFNRFMEDPDSPGDFISITDDRIQKMLEGDEVLIDRYLKTINDAKAFYDRFVPFTSLQITSDDPEVKAYLNDIKRSAEEIAKLPIDEAHDAFAKGYVTRISTNPLVKSKLITVMDGFYQTYGAAWMFNDIMENGTPLLQTILTDVEGDLTAKEIAKRDAIKAHRKEIARIQREAASHGLSIDLNKIIDDEGRFREDYSNAFVDKMTELASNVREMSREHGYGSIQHLKAKLEFDEFKAKHCNQVAKPEYYEIKCQRERYMIENFPLLYSTYMTEFYKKMDLLNYMSEFGVNDEIQKQLDEVNNNIRNLTKGSHYVAPDGTFRPRPSSDTESDQRLVAIYSRQSAETLSYFLEDMSKLNDEFFQYNAVYGFEEQLKINLNIVQSFEKRDANGIPTVPQNVLDANEQYKEAKDWIRKNARFSFKFGNAEGEDTTIGDKLGKAFIRLGLSGNVKSIKLNSFLKRKQNDNPDVTYKDADGVINGTLFTEEDLAVIKEIEESRFQIKDSAPGTDRILISSANAPDTQYSAEFYSKMKTDGFYNHDYLAKVTEINRILEKYYDGIDKTVHLDRIPDTEEGIAELNHLAELYQELRSINSKEEGNEELNRAAKQFRDDHTEKVTNKTAYLSQMQSAMEKSSEYLEAFKKVTLERREDGSYLIVDNKLIPNNYLFSYIKPKGEPGTEEHDRWIDNQVSEDIRLIEHYYRKVPTTYYYDAMREAQKRAQEDPEYDYSEWYLANHVYNPFTKKYEPLPIWVTSKIKEEHIASGEVEGEWLPSYQQTEKAVRDGKVTITNPSTGEEEEFTIPSEDKSNHDYDPDKTTIGNYRKGSGNGEYDTNVVLNDYELMMKKYLQETLMKTARTAQTRRYFERGYLPAKMQKEKAGALGILKEVGKTFGLDFSKRKDVSEWHEEIGYDQDEVPNMPMTQRLSSKKLMDERFKTPEPKLEDFQEEENPEKAFKEAHEDWERAKKEVEQNIHKELLDKDWYKVIETYLAKAADYNAVQDNKQKLYYLLNMLKRQQVYLQKHSAANNMYGSTGNLKVDTRRGSKENPVYDTTIDKNLIEQYTTYMRRILFDQWKEDTSPMVTAANRLQNFTSANYMMLNIRGGIANVTLGETGILAEAAAAEYFGKKDWAFGTAEWNRGLIGFIRGMYSDTSVNLQDAITKYFRVVDYDEQTGVSREIDMEEYAARVRDLMFSPQTIGEHFMQNSVLFAMLRTHKLIPIENDPKGIGVTYMNEAEYIRYRQAELLDDILTEDQQRRFAEFKDDLVKKEDELKDYAWWRKDALTEFIYLHCDDDQINAFIKARDEQEDRFKKEFAEKTNLYDQLELGEDGYLGFKVDSELKQLESQMIQDGKLNKTQALMGRFTERVRKVNNKIHGVYNRKGQAWIEKKWWGSLVMQYHKHLPIGLLKRYRARGFFSETRGTNEKGMIQSIVDFLSLNARKVKHDNGWTDENVGAIESLQFLFKHCLDYIGQLRTTYHMIPKYERANIRRNLGDMVGVISALAFTVGLLAIGDDDDDSIAYNMMLYEADRLGSEAFLYNPIGMWTETKKLMSTPVAAQSILGDAFAGIGNICGYIMGGDDYDMTYHSGRFAGQNKLLVYLKRRIPIYNGIRSVIDTPENNHYYKLGETAMTLVPTKDIAEWIKQ